MIFEEDVCPLCSNDKMEIQSKTRKSKCELKFIYTQYYMKCNECGFSFVSDSLESRTKEDRERCRLEYEEQCK